tara:strand:+ start:1103 stop:1312 length:210 start_codon:yes stop_codon:yes gene_type:complete
MITEQEVMLDYMYADMSLGTWLGDIEDNEVKRKDVIHYMMEDFNISKDIAEKLLEMHYLSNLDTEPQWK